MGTSPDLFKNVETLQRKLMQAHHFQWFHQVFLSWQWCFLLVTFVGTWVVFWRIVDKTRLQYISLCGFLSSFFATTMDSIGLSLPLWGYRYKVIPLYHPFITADFCLIPIICMLCYQFFRSWMSYSMASIVVAFTFAFIGEPIAILMGVYVPFHWTHLFSLPLYFLMFMLSKWVTNGIQKATERAQGRA